MLPDDIKNGLIVSCQPVPDGPMDSPDFVVGYARAAVAAGAKALRIESVPYVKAVRVAVSVPIIGIVKRDLSESPVRITPFIEDAEALAAAGADVIAFDATDRVRPASVEALVRAVKVSGKLTMADCSSLDDARRALAAGVDFVGTTLSGYVGGSEPIDPDIALIKGMRSLTEYVIAEGRIRTPEQAAAAASAGAYAVVVGSAITRTEHATAWFREAISKAYHETLDPETVLAIDIGGTKTMAALVRGQDVIEELKIETVRAAGPDQWLRSIVASVAIWQGRYGRVGMAVTGFVDDGRWSALNPATLDLPADYPLVERAAQAFAVPVFAVNDAQAAAWGEFRFGAGGGGDMVFLTISTGIGGGVVIKGRVLGGLAGHFGLIRGLSVGNTPLEDETSGRWIAKQATKAGHHLTAAEVFAHADRGEGWAKAIVSQSASRVAGLCADIKLMFDPARIVIGGGIGLAPGYLDLVRQHLAGMPDRLLPALVPADLGAHAGVIGAAGLALQAG